MQLKSDIDYGGRHNTYPLHMHLCLIQKWCPLNGHERSNVGTLERANAAQPRFHLLTPEGILWMGRERVFRG